MRFDVYLTENGYFESRNKAAAAIKRGQFEINGKKVLKPAVEVSSEDDVVRIEHKKTYVARSAHKLLTAFERFGLQWSGCVAVDLGASTGGFCQVMLENDVRKIYAVDIGTAQLHPSIKDDPRIVNREKTNARFLSPEDFSEPIDIITADLSFISIKKILPAAFSVLKNGGEAVVLVKPQFETENQGLSKNGVVTDRKIHFGVLVDVAHFAENIGFGICNICFSGLPGESGNREYLLYLKKGVETTASIINAAEAAIIMEDSHE